MLFVQYFLKFKANFQIWNVTNLNFKLLQVIKGSEDNPAQYMNFMNAVFTAQKQVSNEQIGLLSNI